MAYSYRRATTYAKRLAHNTLLALFILFILWMSYRALDELVRTAWENSDGRLIRFLSELIIAIVQGLVPLLVWWGIILALGIPLAWFLNRRLNRMHPDLATARSFPDNSEPKVRLAPGKLFLFRGHSPDVIPLEPMTTLQFGTEGDRVFLRATQDTGTSLVYWLPGSEEDWKAVYEFLVTEAAAYQHCHTYLTPDTLQGTLRK